MRREMALLVMGLALAGCSKTPDADSGPAKDAGVDQSAADGRADAREAGLADRGTDKASADRGKDSLIITDRGLYDAAKPSDLGPLPVHKILFTHGSLTSAMTLATINSDGTGYQAVAGLGGLGLTSSVTLMGTVKEGLPLARDVPVEETGPSSYRPILLPRGLGRLRWFTTGSPTAQVGYFVHRGTQVEVVYQTPGTSLSDLHYYVSVARDGTYAAALRKTGVVIMRLDGVKLSGGQSYVEVNPTPTPGAVYPESITFVGKWLLFIARETTATTSQHTLYAMPRDGSAAPVKVALPQIGGKPVLLLDKEIAGAENGSRALLLASAGITSPVTEEILTVDLAGAAPSVVSLSGGTGDFEARGTLWTSSGSMLALSPKGGFGAYVKTSTATSPPPQELHVAKADGSQAPVHVTDAASIATSGRYIRALRFLDEDNLIFAAGTSTSRMIVFRYQVSSKTLTPLTGTATAKPYDLALTTSYPTSFWLSPNRRYVYFTERQSGVPGDYREELRAIDRQSGHAVKTLLPGGEFYNSGEGLTACANSSRIYFAAELPAQAGTTRDLFTIDLDTPTQAQQLTNHGAAGGTIYVRQVVASPACDYVAYLGPTYSNDILAGKATAPAAITLTSTVVSPKTHGQSWMIASDNSFLALPMGTSGAHSLHVAALQKPGTIPTEIYKPAAGQVYQVLGID